MVIRHRTGSSSGFWVWHRFARQRISAIGSGADRFHPNLWAQIASRILAGVLMGDWRASRHSIRDLNQARHSQHSESSIGVGPSAACRRERVSVQVASWCQATGATYGNSPARPLFGSPVNTSTLAKVLILGGRSMFSTTIICPCADTLARCSKKCSFNEVFFKACSSELSGLS